MKSSRYIILFLAILFYIGCANPITPQGGPKDTESPRLILTNPEYLKVNFDGNEISLTFDEWVVLNNVNKNFIASPPLGKEPNIKLKKRTVHLRFTDSLKKNTTYNFYFGDMIADLNEGNLYKGLTFTLSTGSYVDSLSINGSLVNAFDLKPLKGHLILGYVDNAVPDSIHSDSIAAKIRPDFVTVTDELGKFKMQFLPRKSLQIVAINDLNGNYRYDSELNEEIAFYNEPITPIYEFCEIRDSLMKDSIHIHSHDMDRVNLFSFKYSDSINRVIKEDVSKPMQLGLVLRYPSDSLKYRFIYAKKAVDSIDHITVINKSNDSLLFWFPKYSDSLKIEISSNGKIIDTVNTIIESFEKYQKTKYSLPKPSIQLKYSNNYHYYKPLWLEFSAPVAELYNDKSIFVVNKDSIPVKFYIDSINPCMVMVDYLLSPEIKYELIIADSAFVDIYGNYFPQTNFNISSRSKESYGNFDIKITNETGEQIIIQLLNDKEAIVREHIIRGGDETVKFDLLNRGEYSVKAIIDLNKNGRWDSGNYYRKREPESVLFFEKKINIRENWDLEEEWSIVK